MIVPARCAQEFAAIFNERAGEFIGISNRSCTSAHPRPSRRTSQRSQWTLRDPVRTDSRGKSGVMHGLSSSGQTTSRTADDHRSNNEMVRLREEEEIEIARILLEYRGVRSNLNGIAAIADALAEIDFTHAKARLSVEFNWRTAGDD